MAEANAQDVHSPEDLPDPTKLPELIIYGHSTLLYWWPAWVIGFILGALTLIQGQDVTIEGQVYKLHPSQNLGLIYTIVLLLLVLFTNITVRGLASVLVILSVLFVAVLFAWLDWWDEIISVIPWLGVPITASFFFFFSTVLFVMWLLAYFVFDRLKYWRVQPGQLTEERWIGGGAKTYDTRGLLFEKHLEDFFRNWILGLGSGDLRLYTSGARSHEFNIRNVMFVDRKVKAIQKLVAIEPGALLNEQQG